MNVQEKSIGPGGKVFIVQSIFIYVILLFRMIKINETLSNIIIIPVICSIAFFVVNLIFVAPIVAYWNTRD